MEQTVSAELLRLQPKIRTRIITFDDVELLYGTVALVGGGHAGSSMSLRSASFVHSVGSAIERGGTGREGWLDTEL